MNTTDALAIENLARAYSLLAIRDDGRQRERDVCHETRVHILNEIMRLLHPLTNTVEVHEDQ